MNVDQYISSGVLELYAAHALPPHEMREVEAMAEKHARVRAELDAIMEGLKKYAEFYSPGHREDLFDKISERIKEMPAEPEIPEQRTISIEKPEEKAPQQIVDGSAAVVLQQTGGRRWYAWLAAASVLLLMVSVAANIYLYNQYNDSQQQIADLQGKNAVMASNNDALKASYNKTADQLKLFTDPANKMVMMKGMPISPASEVMVIWNTRTKDVFVDVHRMPTPPDGMQYQLWAIDENGKPVDAGLLTPYKEQKVHGPQPMKPITGAVAFAITLEHKGGSPTPTMDKMYVKGAV